MLSPVKFKLGVLVVTLVAVVGVLMVPWRSGGASQATMESISKLNGQWVGRPAPAFALPDLSGQSHTLAEYRGKVIFLNFWGSFCKPCREEMPSMERLVNTYKDRGLVMVAISLDPKAADAAAFMRAFLPGRRSSMVVLHDPESKTSAQYGTEKLPETYIIDRNGRLVARFVNAYDWTRPEVKQLIEATLNDQDATTRPVL